MKIYDEVTIDMNPESSTYGKHLSEESHEYNGDVALCGGGPAFGKHSVDFPSNLAGTPGISAFASPDRSVGRAHSYPQSLDLGLPEAAHSYGHDRRLSQESLPNVGQLKPGGFDQYETKKRHWYGGTKSYPRRTAIINRAEEINRKFGEPGGWYDQYLTKGFTDPLTTIAGPNTDYGKGAFVPLRQMLEDVAPAEAAVQSDFDWDALPAPPSEWGTLGGDISKGPLVAKSTKGAAEQATEDVGRAKSDLVKAEGDYKDELKRIEDFRGDVEEEKLTTRALRKKNLFEKDLARRDFLRGVLPASETRQADIARTGMAFSGPAQRMVEEAAAEEGGTLRDIIMDKRDIENVFQEDLKVAEEKLEQADDEEKAADDLWVEKQQDWTDAKTDYGMAIKNMVSDASDSVSDLFTYTQDLAGAHAPIGANTGLVAPTKSGEWKTGGYKWKLRDDPPHYQKTKGYEPGSWQAYTAPGAGGGGGTKWWTETQSQLPMVDTAQNIIQSAQDFNSFLMQQSPTFFSSLIPDMPGLGPKDKSNKDIL